MQYRAQFLVLKHSVAGDFVGYKGLKAAALLHWIGHINAKSRQFWADYSNVLRFLLHTKCA